MAEQDNHHVAPEIRELWLASEILRTAPAHSAQPKFHRPFKR